MNVGKNVKKLRELKNFTQQYMAERLQVSQKTYSNIEAAGNNVTVEVIGKIAHVLDVTIHTVLELNLDAIFNSAYQEGGLSSLNTVSPNNDVQEKEAAQLQNLIDEKNSRITQLESALLVKDELINELRQKY